MEEKKMGKIIDTDDLKNYIQNHRVDVSTSTTRTGNKELLVVKNGKWESLLDEIPAAYNIDKVIEEMKSKSIPVLDEDEHIMPESNLHEPCEIQMIPLSEAIEIVKRGLSDSLLQESSQFQQEDFEPDR
jgi:hypothetical protein